MNNSIILWHNFVGIFFLHLINDLIIYTYLSFIKVSSMTKWQHSNIHRSSKIARPHQGFSAVLPVAWLKVLKSSQPFSTRHVTVCQFILKSKNTLCLMAWSRTEQSISLFKTVHYSSIRKWTGTFDNHTDDCILQPCFTHTAIKVYLPNNNNI